MRTLVLLTTSVSLASLAFAGVAEAKSAKSTYCDNQDYYTNSGDNAGDAYPHLHCGKDWITYSKNSNQHYNFYVGDSILDGKANSACTQADAQDADKLKAKIKKMCDDDGKTYNDCD
jgi:hypothetical protein